MFKKIAMTGCAVALGAGALMSVSTTGAEAKKGWHHNNGWAAAGGFVAGALVGSALTQPRYYEPAPEYVPAPAYYGHPEPWTPAWYRYCSSKYRSFNPDTGYFVTYSGRQRFCR
ncbi:MAG: BA14K family protein [Stappia sp.]|uniref:BA14K family protein n=1 Tax=Stappia sp. TaxID=1870903 RepID=UPI000C65D3AD|nr:BA14K family protein [Stappia sp.]MAB00217.1 BA14K family protein [Stappia sp.]MBM21057.1 BA14K family protein [Stappia sp.]